MGNPKVLVIKEKPVEPGTKLKIEIDVGVLLKAAGGDRHEATLAITNLLASIDSALYLYAPEGPADLEARVGGKAGFVKLIAGKAEVEEV